MFETFIAYKIAMANTDSNSETFINDLNNVTLLGTIFSFTISFATAYLAYQCNQKTDKVSRYLITIIAFLFSGLYLVYYLFAHVVFGSSCKTKPISLKKLKKML